MAIKRSSSLLIFGLSLLISAPSYAFDPVRLHCMREEDQGVQHFLSLIQFKKEEVSVFADFDQIKGEVLSYTVHDSEKSFISGYSLFSITTEDHVIRGLTGDPITRTDGKFTLTRLGEKNNGSWKFIYTNTNQESIEAIFECTYDRESAEPIPYAPSPSLMPSR